MIPAEVLRWFCKTGLPIYKRTSRLPRLSDILIPIPDTMSSSEMVDLAEIIHTNTIIVNLYYLDRNLTPPSIHVNSPLTTVISDEKAATARWTVLAAMHELRCLILGPSEALMSVGVRPGYASDQIS